MKYLVITLLLTACFNNADQIKEAETTGQPQHKDTQIQNGSQNPGTQPTPSAEENAEAGFMEENDMCICTKEWKPVCGENGQTYPNSCQAGCDKVKFTEGTCKKKE